VNLIEKTGLFLLHRLEPERAHHLSLRALKAGLTPQPGAATSRRLRTTIAGLDLPNPVGLAAGYDKNAVAVDPLLRSGFGFVELGAATPRPQPGNPRPRLFRLTSDQAIINRFGFNNVGAQAISQRLAARRAPGIVGLNLGANKDSEDRAGDYVNVLETCGAYIDFATINVSSPNTAHLRELQQARALSALLSRIMRTRAVSCPTLPIFLKIAPDIDEADIVSIARVALDLGVDAIIATNTTLARNGLTHPSKNEAGGLSGRPLFDRSTRVLALLARESKGRIALVGVGGIGSARDAYAKICAGASAVQIYTAMIYQGIGLASEIARGLDRLLAENGYANVADAVGSQQERFI